MYVMTRTAKHTLYPLVGLFTIILIGVSTPAFSQSKAEKTFTVITTDHQGIETEIKNVQFYWEEKVSETAFVPHELKHVPVKRGNATVNVKFDGIRTIEVKSPVEKGLPLVVISLTNGNSGEFSLALPGSFKGQSDFGETDLPASAIQKIVFK